MMYCASVVQDVIGRTDIDKERAMRFIANCKVRESHIGLKSFNMADMGGRVRLSTRRHRSARSALSHPVERV